MMVDLEKAYQSTQVNDDVSYYGAGEEEEFELASPWKRIGAYLVNRIIEVLLLIPAFGILIAMFASSYSRSNNDPMAMVGASFGMLGLTMVLYLVYAGVQIYFMSRDGQSLGKKLLKIRVVTENGETAGFVPNVLLREIVYNVAIGVVFFVIGLILGFVLGDTGANIASVLGYIPLIVCLVLLFMESRNRQTLQDMLAKTYVVEAD